MKHLPFDMTLRVGCRLVYEAEVPTAITFSLKPRSDVRQIVREETISFGACLPPHETQDHHGNLTHRTVLAPGRNEVRHDALIAIPSLPDNHEMQGEPAPVWDLPSELTRYILPSRYCDSDKLLDLAWRLFGQVPHGLPRVQAICDWVHRSIEYRTGSGRPDLSASDIVARGYGVCRDFAHVGIALCRAFNLPTRYVSGHLPDIGCLDSGAPMDFHAYFEVYVGGAWFTFDPRFNVPRIGRVKVAQGFDAVDGAFATIFGGARLAYFEVWNYQVNPEKISLRDPVHLDQRIDGTATIRMD